MKKHLLIISALSTLLLTGCGTVDAAYQGGKGMTQSAVSGVGNFVGSGANDASKTFNVVSGTAGKVLTGAGNIVGGGLELVGGVVKGTTDIVAPAPAK